MTNPAHLCTSILRSGLRAGTMPGKVLHACSALFLGFVCLLVACGGGASQVAISISPTTATLNPNQQQQFQATVTGSNDTTVQWQVDGIRGGNAQFGTITATGLYTAPTSDRTFQVMVTAVADVNPAKTATALVTVNGIGVGGGGGGSGSVMVGPSRAALTLTETQQFTATTVDVGWFGR